MNKVKASRMNIYFAGSIRGGRADASLYHDIIAYLGTWGKVLTEHVGDPSLTEKGDDGPNDRAIYQRDMAWLGQSDVLVAEVTQTSMGVGYELGSATLMGKPVLALYRPSEGKSLSAMIAGCPDIAVVEYRTFDQAKHAIRRFIENIQTESVSHG